DISDVRHLKASLCKLHGFPTCMQQLLHNGNSLENSFELDALMNLQLILVTPSNEAQQLKAAGELLDSCARGNLQIARLLLEAGANKNAKDDLLRTALMLTAERGHVEIVRLLLQAGADKDMQDCLGETALTLAAQNGHVEIARLLLQAGADKDLQRHVGCTALMIAAYYGHTEIVRLLLQAGADTAALRRLHSPIACS
ncbi:mask, partial [Symbiodinium pilosum]